MLCVCACVRVRCARGVTDLNRLVQDLWGGAAPGGVHSQGVLHSRHEVLHTAGGSVSQIGGCLRSPAGGRRQAARCTRPRPPSAAARPCLDELAVLVGVDCAAAVPIFELLYEAARARGRRSRHWFLARPSNALHTRFTLSHLFMFLTRSAAAGSFIFSKKSEKDSGLGVSLPMSAGAVAQDQASGAPGSHDRPKTRTTPPLNRSLLVGHGGAVQAQSEAEEGPPSLAGRSQKRFSGVGDVTAVAPADGRCLPWWLQSRPQTVLQGVISCPWTCASWRSGPAPRRRQTAAYQTRRAPARLPACRTARRGWVRRPPRWASCPRACRRGLRRQHPGARGHQKRQAGSNTHSGVLPRLRPARPATHAPGDCPGCCAPTAAAARRGLPSGIALPRSCRSASANGSV